MFITTPPHKHPYNDNMLRVRFYGPRDPKKPRVNNEPPEWSYWNRNLVDLDEAICLTLNFDPRSYFSEDSNSWRYNELRDIAISSISDGSLQFQNKFTREKFRAVDWLQWLKMMELSAPVCGEILVKPLQAGDIGLGSDCASDKNADLRPLIASSGLLRSEYHRPTVDRHAIMTQLQG